MLLNKFPSIRKLISKNVKINSVKVKIKVIILIERTSLDYFDFDMLSWTE